VKDCDYFRGVRAASNLNAVVAEENVVLRAYNCVRPDAPVFFGFSLDWGFPAFGIHNAKNMSLVFSELGEYSPQIENRFIDQFISNDYKIVIYQRGQYPYVPRRLYDYLFSHYDVTNTEFLSVHVARDWKPFADALAEYKLAHPELFSQPPSNTAP
jgi:hypothetical protein